MQNRKWKSFGKLVEKCYSNMIGVEKDGSCWKNSFDLFKEILLEDREKNPGFAPRLEMVDEETEFKYDVLGWIEDCLDEMDMKQEYQYLLKMYDDLLTMFSWSEGSVVRSEFMVGKAAALGSLGKSREAVTFCREWIWKEPENIMAAMAGGYVFIGIKAYDEAEKLLDSHIFERTNCTDENDVMFTAASTLYQLTGKKKGKKRGDAALKEYEEKLLRELESFDFEDEDFDFLDEELPFD